MVKYLYKECLPSSGQNVRCLWDGFRHQSSDGFARFYTYHNSGLGNKELETINANGNGAWTS